MPFSTMHSEHRDALPSRSTEDGAADGAAHRSRTRPGTTYVVGSGQGGAGKSSVSIWLADALAGCGQRVLLHDAAPMLPCLHRLLGIAPAPGRGQPLQGKAHPADRVHRLAERLWLLPGEADADLVPTFDPLDRARLQLRLSQAFRGYDAVVLDTGAGPESVVRSLTLGGDALLLVTTPEPGSIRETYGLLKVVTTASPVRRVQVVVNRARSREQGEAAFAALERTCRAVLGCALDCLALLPEDPSLTRAVDGYASGLERLRSTAVARSFREQLAARFVPVPVSGPTGEVS